MFILPKTLKASARKPRIQFKSKKTSYLLLRGALEGPSGKCERRVLHILQDSCGCNSIFIWHGRYWLCKDRNSEGLGRARHLDWPARLVV